VSKHQNPGPDFEQRLLDQLQAVVAERGATEVGSEATRAEVVTLGRRGPRLALGGAVALAAVAAGLIVSAGGDNTPAAFAVEPQEGGGVMIKVYSLSDASGLEQALEEAGIPSQVTWLPAGMVCREPHYRPSTVHLPGGGTLGGMTMGGPGVGMTFGIGSTQQWRERVGEHMRGEIPDDEFEKSTPNLNLDPEAFRPDQSVILSGAPAPYDGDPEGGSVAKMGIAEGPVEPCEPVPAPPNGSGPYGLPQSAGGEADYAPSPSKAGASSPD
jgi:hypothetical protein